MSFINKLEDELNVSTTENGAIGYKTTKKEIVDFNFKISSYRNKGEEEIVDDFKRAWGEDKELAYKFLFCIFNLSSTNCCLINNTKSSSNFVPLNTNKSSALPYSNT